VTAPLWDRLVRPVIEVKDGPFPAPVKLSTECTVRPLPAPVKAVADKASTIGWMTRIQDSTGYMPHATHGRPGDKPVDVWAVRMRKGDRSAVAVRTGTSWDMLYTWSSDMPWTKHGTLGDLRWWLACWCPIPVGTEFAESMGSKKRGPAHIRLVDGAVWADAMGEPQIYPDRGGGDHGQ
jgi:hypothetical protein